MRWCVYKITRLSGKSIIPDTKSHPALYYKVYPVFFRGVLAAIVAWFVRYRYRANASLKERAGNLPAAGVIAVDMYYKALSDLEGWELQYW